MSISQLSSYLRCGEQYRLEKVHHVPSRPSWAAVGGKAVHAGTEDWDHANLQGGGAAVTLDLVTVWTQRFEDSIKEEEERSGYESADFRASGRASKAWPDKENRQWWEQNGPLMLERYVAWRQTSPWEVWETPAGEPAIELEVTASFGVGEDKTPVKAFIDRVMVHTGDGTLAVVDIKSGSIPSGTMQLGQYAESLARVLDWTRPQYGFYWNARTGSTTAPEELDRWSGQFFDYAHKGVTERKKKQDLYLPQVSNLCASCGVRDYCRYVGGEKAGEVPAAWEETA